MQTKPKDAAGQPYGENVWSAQREQWTRDVTSLMALVTIVAAVLIAVGTLAGFFIFQETLPIYIVLALITPAWWGARQGGWRWARYFPALLCFGLGFNVTFYAGFLTIFVLFYAIAVLLAAMLVDNPMATLVMVASILSYIGLGARVDGFSTETLPYMISFSFALLAIALLQGYTLTHLQRVLKAQNEGNETLKAEIKLRRDAERTQREQEAQLRRLADHTTDLVAEIAPDGTFLYTSPSYRNSLGYEPGVLLGTNAFDTVHPDDLTLARENANQAAFDHMPRWIQVRVRRADGQYIFMEISGNPMYDEQGSFTGFVLSSRDINRQKQAEFALQESETKFRQIIESLPLGVHMYSLQDDGSLIFSGCNPAANSILDTDHTSLLGMPIESAFPGLTATDIPARYKEVARSGGIWRNEQVDYIQNPILGSFEVHAFQTSPSKMVAVFSDITQRIRAAEALRLSEEKFSTAFITSPDSVNINRLSDGVYIDINQGFTRLMGYSREEVLGKSSLELNIWADPADRARLVQSLREDGVVENMEAHFHRKNGEVGVGLMSARVIVIQGEKCILSITRDVTERIQAEMTLRASEAELREAHARLGEAYDATLRGWAAALELRERETANHSQRVVELSLQVARELGIWGDDLVHLQRGALMHDIGKLGVPDQVLLKPGELTSDEWVIMRMHTEFGRNLLKDVDYLRPCITIPYYHHEKWDGSGYPEGLKGEDIPLPARIFAVVDVYDALTHDRPYRPAWSHLEACRYLTEQIGKHFDPAIVETFIKIVSQPAVDPLNGSAPK